ncbi:unnamed protein product [Diatraea saccharalis]|uniref:Death domain-containing protein n=1 Tax=Diatraea saccharalis TaxID=40085 RepID=A0A9N9QWZ9_9NEOP|nr:unnamed protein product [Diatraea saccharalis]
MTLSEYSHLREQVIKSFSENERHGQLLSSLKELFREKINSPRRFEEITTIGQLLRILEIRDALSENNIQPLKDIVHRLPSNSRLLQRIIEYEQSHVPVEPINYYASEHLPQQSHRAPVESFVTNNLNTTMSEKKVQRIKQTIIEDIGVFWKDFGRSLGIKENTIDEINEDYRKVPMKAKQVLEIYLETKADSKTWFYDICEALESSRRKDLCKKIKKISVMNI